MLFSFSGKVKKNLQRGRDLGFPTANIDVHPDTQEGIFIGMVQIESKDFPALIFVGSPLTFEEYDKKAEIYILDFKEDIYKKELNMTCLKKIRDNMKFESKEALICQMKEDERQAREYFSNQSSSRMRGSNL